MKSIRSLFLLLSFITLTVCLSAQTGFRTQSARGLSDDVSINQVSLSNAWFGSSFSYQLTGDANFNENFLFNANILYNLEFNPSSWSFPVVGNISLPTNGSSLQDVEIGIFPWKILSKSGDGVIVVGHGGLSYSIDPETETGLSPQRFRVLAGIEVSVPLGSNNLPLTASLTPVFESYNLDRGTTFGAEGTFILPIAPNLGVIGELYVPFKSDFNTFFSAGVLVNGAIGGN